MAFWLRAGLVIGAIYYLSPLRLGEAQAPPPLPLPPSAHAQAAHAQAVKVPAAPGSGMLGEIAGPVLAALPDALRARMVETAAAEAGRALGTGLRAAASETVRPPSRDTLISNDRQPAWRGVPEREVP